MARHESPEQRATVRRVMHEFKHGELDSAQGGKVKSPKQAIAIALSEAGASNQQSEETNRKRRRTTKSKERAGRTARRKWRASDGQAERCCGRAPAKDNPRPARRCMPRRLGAASRAARA